MHGAQLRCQACNQYAPDRCLCGESITDPAIKARMAAARTNFEADITAEYGPGATKGSPNYIAEFVVREWRAFWRVWQAATAHTDDTISQLQAKNTMLEAALQAQNQGPIPIPAAFFEISRLLHTQHNCGTAEPLFIVQQKCTYVTEEGYNDDRYEWRETKSGDHLEASPSQAKRLESLHQSGRSTDGWKRYSVFDNWEYVTACFTKKGCEDYLAINGHNLKGARIYAETAFRNFEFQTVRKWLMSLTPAPQSKEKI
jgi:hypothetical protein